MKTFFLSFAGALAAMFAFLAISFFGLLMLIASAASSGPKPPENIVLSMDMNIMLPDQAPKSGFAAFAAQPGFLDIITKLKAAESDEKVKGLYIRAPSAGFGSSRSEEFRQALQSFQDSGRFVIAHTQGSYGVSGPSALTSITAADEIWMQEGTDIFATGVTFETEFYKGLFDLTGAKSEIYPFFEYKNAPNSYNEASYTEPHREAMLALATSVWDTSLSMIAEDRGMSVADTKRILESGPKTTAQALEIGLIDRTGWPEDAEAAAIERGGKGAELLDIFAYSAPSVSYKAPKIAVVGGEGAVVTGGSGSGNPFASTIGFASDTIARAILDAADDEDVKAIVFRVDSPGGSPTASDQIWHAVETAKERGKPVVVSMGSVAASGGYYVSTGADYIFANEATITGSIGIFGGKFAIDGALEKVGVTFDRVSVGGDFADAYGADAFNQYQEAEVKAWLKRGYDRFLTLVGEGRGMTYDEVHEIARGRVWSGRDGVKVGLVDEIGTFMDAVNKAKELGGIDADTDVRLRYFPASKSGFEAFDQMFGVSEETARALNTMSMIAGDDRTRIILEELATIDAMKSGEALATAPRIRER